MRLVNNIASGGGLLSDYTVTGGKIVSVVGGAPIPGPQGPPGPEGPPGPAGPAGSATDISASITAAAVKSPPVDADSFVVADSADTNKVKRITWGNVKAAFKAWWSTETATLSNKTLVGPVADSITASTTDLNLVPKGAGNVTVSGVPVVTTTAAQSLSNKTLTNPVLLGPSATSLKDNGSSKATAIVIDPVPNGVNYLRVRGTAAGGGSAALMSDGADASVDINLTPKGPTPTVRVVGSNGTTPCITAAAGTDLNVSLNLQSRGSGTVQVNGVPVVTTTSVQALSQKTIRGSVNTLLLDGAVPASKTAAGTPGQIAVEAGFVYVCVANNQWQRAALTDW